MKSYLVNYTFRGIYGVFSSYVEACSEEEASNAMKLYRWNSVGSKPAVKGVREIKEIPEDCPYYDSFGFLRGAKITTETTMSHFLSFGT